VLVECVVSRTCVDATGLVVRAGGIAKLRPDPRAGQVVDVKTGRKREALPEWATPVEAEKSTAKEKSGVPEKPAGK
jgi:hypothetical protein